mmetsp:Transcript_131380/g.420502  ORF Transcript_131380/g.420502 Transcript_131380/m.420502 type:complete len:469 (-) Transcript_131380:70-1476(-)
MVLKGARRPNSLISQTHDSLRSQEAANRQQRVQLVSGGGSSSTSSGVRPPQLPGAGYPPGVARTSPSGSGGSALPPCSSPGGSPSGSSCANLPELPELSSSTGLASLTASVSARRSSSRGGLVGGPSPNSRPSSKQSSRGAAGGGSTPRRSPSSAASSRSGGTRPRASSAAAAASPLAAEEEEEDEDDDFLSELEDLAALSRHLNLQIEDPVAADPRPTTGGTSASASTTEDTDDLQTNDIANSGEDRLPVQQRVYNELQNCKLPHGCRVEGMFGASAQFFFVMDVTEGPYTPATLTFWVKIFDDFPTEGSFSVRSSKRFFHPGIDPMNSRVEIPLERLTVNGGTSIRALLLAIRELVVAPSDALAVNGDAAMLLQTDPDEFRRTVRLTLNGGDYGGAKFDRVLNPNKPGGTLSSIGSSTSAAVADKPLADQTKVDLMQLEVMKDDFKKQASEWQQQNLREIHDLGSV